MQVLIYGNASRKDIFQRPGDARSLADACVLVAQGLRAKGAKCGYRNPGTFSALEIEPCDAVVLINDSAFQLANDRIREALADNLAEQLRSATRSPVRPCTILLLELPPIPEDTDDGENSSLNSFNLRLDDGSEATGETTWTAEQIAFGVVWDTLYPQIEAAHADAIRGGSSSTDSALRGRLAKANRTIGELRGKIENLEVKRQQAEREIAEEATARQGVTEDLGKALDEIAALKAKKAAPKKSK